MQRLGIVGGSFDPPHLAHLILGEHAHEELALTRVLFVPAGVPPHKEHTRTPVKHRLSMLQLAVGDNAKFAISRVDLDREGPHYSVDMVNLLRDQHPDALFFFIMGEDMFNDLPNWKRAEGLFTHSDLRVAVMRRLGSHGVLRADKHEARFPGLAERVTFLTSPLVEISSTGVVQRLRDGKSARYLIPDSVLSDIETNGLYKDN